MLDITQKLVEINEELEPEDITSIKFLCQDHIAQHYLNKIDDGLQFFRELERLGKINFSRGEMDYLLECLCRCHRIDLIKKMGFNKDQVQDRVKSGNSNFSAFRLLLFEIADDVDEEDFKKFRFIFEQDIPGLKLGKIKSIHDLFIQLERYDIISPEDVNVLCMLSETTFLSTLNRKVRAYQEQLSTGTYPSVIGNRNQPPAEPSPGHRAGTSSEVPVHVLAPENDVDMEEQSPGDSGLTAGNESVSDKSSQEISSGGLNPVINQSIQDNRQDDVIVKQMEAVSIDSDFYKMNAKPRGVAIIINNEHFKKIRMDRSSNELSDRIGSEKDADLHTLSNHGHEKALYNNHSDCPLTGNKLVNTWKKLGFKVRTYNDLDSTHMIQILDEAAQEDHSKYDCLVVCILSHGILGHVYGSDGLSVKINRLTGFFSGRSSLVGKPKLFFMQACQGEKKQKGHAIETDAGESMEEISQERQDLNVDGPRELIPAEADFLLGYATAPGYVSYRTKLGSTYISTLTNNLDKFADKLDLLSILTKVNEEVGRAQWKRAYKQIPSPMFTLRKKILFK